MSNLTSNWRQIGEISHFGLPTFKMCLQYILARRIKENSHMSDFEPIWPKLGILGASASTEMMRQGTQQKTQNTHRAVKFSIQIVSDWPQMGQIWDFVRWVSVHFVSPWTDIGDKRDKRLNVSPQLVVDSVVAGFPESLFIIYFGIIAFFRVINRNRRMN